MATSSRHTARAILEAFYDAERVYMSAPADQRDFSGIAATLSPGVRLFQTSGLPYAGIYEGVDGFQDWGRRMADYFEVVDVQNPEFFESEGSDRIVVLSNVRFKVRATGQELDYPFAQAVTVDREEGVIVEMRPFYWDVHDLNKAVGYQS